MLPTTSYTQFTTIADNIDLKEDQREYAQQNLDTGSALVSNRKTGVLPVEIPLYTTQDGGELKKNEQTVEHLDTIH